MEKNVQVSMLLEIYGALLTKTQYEFLDDYYNSDLSLSEIAENRKVSRQASFMVLNKCIKKLEDFEEKVGAVKAKKEYKEKISAVVNFLEKGNVKSALNILKKEV